MQRKTFWSQPPKAAATSSASNCAKKDATVQEGWATLLALFPYFPPQQFKVEDAAGKLPTWLHDLFRPLRTNQQTQELNPAPPLQSSGVAAFEDRIFLNRILGLSNLYYIDPEDKEILQELREVRLETVRLMLSVGRDELARQFQSDFGDRFWAMAQSGIQKENLDSNEINQRDALQQWLSETPQSLHQEGGIQRFAAVLLFNSPGSVKLADPDRICPHGLPKASSGSARWHRAEPIRCANSVCPLQLPSTVPPPLPSLCGQPRK